MATTLTDLHSQQKLADLAAELALKDYKGPGGQQFAENPAYAAIAKAGSELWFDTGDEAAARKLWAREMSGLTTNNTLVNQVVQTGALDDTIKTIGQRLREAYPGISQHDLVIEAAFILNARIALGLVEAFGATVSVELHPDVADDWQGSVAFGKRYFAICPEHFLVKVPMTPDGFIAVRKLADAGVPVNFTLGFSVRQNYFASLFSHPRYVNIFLGRLNVLVKDNKLGSGENVGEHVALASQEAVEELRHSHREVPTKQIAASLRAGVQVEQLAGIDVQTIPPKVAQEYLESKADLSKIHRHSSTEFPIDITDASARDQVAVLWEVTDAFKKFTDDAVRSVARIESGAGILTLAAEHGVDDFFRHWSVDEQLEIRKAGKIPDFHRWKAVAAADDMMSQAALQSFATDQGELDARIERLIS